MPKIVTPLTASKIQSAKPRDKLYKLSDGGGLALWVFPTGIKSWKLAYRANGKPNTVTLGSFPQFGLQEAREWREEVKGRLFRGESLCDKLADSKKEKMLIDDLLPVWLLRWQPTVTVKYGKQVERAIYDNCMPYLRGRDVREITTFDIVQSLRGMEERNVMEYLRRTKTGLNVFFDDLVGQGIIPLNPVAAVGKRVFKPHESKHFEALSPAELPLLVRWLETGANELRMKWAIYWQLLTMTRPNETAAARWADIEDGQWVIGAGQMKKRRLHIVPVSSALRALLSEIESIDGGGVFVFKGKGRRGHIHEGSFNKALRDAGLPTTAHGLRALAATSLEEAGFEERVIKAALAHAKGDGDMTTAAYLRSSFFEQRREMLAWWGNKVWQVREEVRLR